MYNIWTNQRPLIFFQYTVPGAPGRLCRVGAPASVPPPSVSRPGDRDDFATIRSQGAVLVSLILILIKVDENVRQNMALHRGMRRI